MEIYLDNGASTKTDKMVFNSMVPFFLDNYANSSSLHSEGLEANNAVEKAREIISKKINAFKNEIIFTSGGTESNNLAIKGTAYSLRKKGNHIITTKVEHSSVVETCKHLETEGFEVTYIDVDKYGVVDPEKIRNSLKKSTILVSVMHANNEIGTINDIRKIGQICRRNGVIFHTDAVQSLTKTLINAKKDFLDLISISSHKIHGPKGIGALYKREGVVIEREMDGGIQEFGLRAGTLNVPAIVGFGKAVEISNKREILKMEKLRDFLIKEILKIKNTFLNGHPKKRLCNNINIFFSGVSGESMLKHLDKYGIEVSLGAACHGAEIKTSQVLKAIGLSKEDATSSIRFTLSKFTTKKELVYTVKKLREIVGNLRKI